MLKLLIADDEESIRNGLKCIVDWESLGFTVCTEAANGNEAVQSIKEYWPDLVLLDIKMPGKTGIEVLEEISSYSKAQNLEMPSFLILSGFSQFEYAQKALNYGAKGYLLKPVDEDELVEKVNIIGREISRIHDSHKDSITAKKFETREYYKNLLLNGNLNTEEYSDDEYTVMICSSDFFPNDDKSLIEKCIDKYFSFFSNAHEEAVLNCIERFYKHYSKNTFITLGRKGKGYKGLINSYRDAETYLNYLFFISDVRAIDSDVYFKKIKEKTFLY